MYETLNASQPEAINMLLNSLRKNRLSHAYIFEGEAGTRKRETALFFAAMLLCENQKESLPCGECKHCRRIRNLTHPNLIRIAPRKVQILKEDILAMQAEFNKTAVEPGAKIYIVEQADAMNAYAANALLKFLEEPHPDIYGILTTDNATKLLPTIRSRSQRIAFHALSPSAVRRYLEEQGYETADCRLAARLAHTITAAEQVLSTPDIRDIVDAVKALYERLAAQKAMVLAFADLSEGLMNTHENTALFLDVMMCYQRDLMHASLDDRKSIVFDTEMAVIEDILTFKTKAMLREELARMLALKAKLNQYIHERLAFDNLMLMLERRTGNEQ